MSAELLLVAQENRHGGAVLVTDAHRYHLVRHLSYAWRPRVLLHILRHLKMWRSQYKLGLPTLTLEDFRRRYDRPRSQS